MPSASRAAGSYATQRDLPCRTGECAAHVGQIVVTAPDGAKCGQRRGAHHRIHRIELLGNIFRRRDELDEFAGQ
jgi:hypothetical protein